jgi:hypothetical protein
MNRTPSADTIRELTQRLWAERQLLEILLFKLVTARLIIASDIRRYVTPALAEVEHAVERLRACELARAIVVDKIACETGLRSTDLSLQTLVELADEPAASILADHRESFLRLTAEIQEVSAHSATMASAALEHIRRNLDSLMGAEPDTTYGPQGRPRRVAPKAHRLDQVV